MLRRTIPLVLVALAWVGPPAGSLLWAQDQAKQYDDRVRSAHRTEILGYLLGGVGLLLVVASIPLGIYFDRKKKARKQSGQREAPGTRNDEGPAGPAPGERG